MNKRTGAEARRELQHGLALERRAPPVHAGRHSAAAHRGAAVEEGLPPAFVMIYMSCDAAAEPGWPGEPG